MQQKITPAVLNLVIINVLVYVAVMVMLNSGTQAVSIPGDYFTLHKSNLLGFRNVIEVDLQAYYLDMPIPLTDKSGLNTFSLNAENASSYLEGNPTLAQQLASYLPEANAFKPIQIVTHFFNHSPTSFFHILINMFVLIMFGPIMEMVMGFKRFLTFYLFCGLFGGLLIAFLDPTSSPVLGASGAISGVLLGFSIYFPRQTLLLFFVIPMQARTLAWAVGVGSAILVVLQATGVDIGSLGTVSHFGHLAGMIAALVFFYGSRYVPFLK